MLRISVRLALTASVIALSAFAAMADDSQITRGKYLVTLGGCNDCHTPGYFLGIPTCHAFSPDRTWASRFRERASL